MNSYKSLFKIMSDYWSSYGGFRALISSPFFHLAVLITLISYDFWLKEDWWLTSIEILPNLIGFTLGGYAILLAFSDQRFLDIITHKLEGENTTPYIELNSSFVHFLILQISALLVSLIWLAAPIKLSSFFLNASQCIPSLIEVYSVAFIISNFLSYLLFIYSLTSALGAILWIFRIATVYDDIDLTEE